MHTFSSKYTQLTNKQRKILNYIIENAEDVCYISLKELADRVGASEVSVLRVCRELGFEGFSELKKTLRNREQMQLYSLSEIEELVRQSPAGMHKQKHDLFNMICQIEQRNAIDMIKSLDVDRIFECANALLNAHEVVIFGHNASKALADYLAHRLNYLRVNAYAVKLGDSDTVKTALVRLDQRDFVVFFSFPPYHYPTAEVVKYAQMRRARIITITDDLASPAVASDGLTFICKTKVPFFYNALSMPMMFVELLVSSMAIQLGERIDRIIKEELLVSKFIDGDR